MSKVDELLSPEPTDVEVQVAADVGIQALTISEYRLRLGRQFLQEAAKLVCPLCDIGYPLVLGLNDGETGSQYEHENRGYNQGRCLADKIHALLAETEAENA